MQPDILERLKAYDHEGWTSDLRECVREAIAEIEFLRSIAGAVTRGESYADIVDSESNDLTSEEVETYVTRASNAFKKVLSTN